MSAILIGLAADAVVLLHFGFIVFVVIGGFLVLRWTGLIWLHVPALIWGIVIEYTGWICPLTPLEIKLREQAGEAGYSGGFIDHYIMPLIYPPGLTHTTQIIIASTLLITNAVLYFYIIRRLMTRRTRHR